MGTLTKNLEYVLVSILPTDYICILWSLPIYNCAFRALRYQTATEPQEGSLPRRSLLVKNSLLIRWRLAREQRAPQEISPAQRLASVPDESAMTVPSWSRETQRQEENQSRWAPDPLPSPTDLGITAKINAFCFVGRFHSKVLARKDVGEAHVFTSVKYSLPASETSPFLALCYVVLVRSNDSRHDERVLQRGYLLDLQICTG